MVARCSLMRPIPSLSEEEVAALWEAMREVLQGSSDAGGAPFELNLPEGGQKGGLGRSVPVPVGGRGAVYDREADARVLGSPRPARQSCLKPMDGSASVPRPARRPGPAC